MSPEVTDTWVWVRYPAGMRYGRKAVPTVQLRHPSIYRKTTASRDPVLLARKPIPSILMTKALPVPQDPHTELLGRSHRDRTASTHKLDLGVNLPGPQITS